MEHAVHTIPHVHYLLQSVVIVVSNTADIGVTILDTHHFPIHTTGKPSSTEAGSNTGYEETSELHSTQYNSASFHYILFFYYYAFISLYLQICTGISVNRFVITQSSNWRVFISTPYWTISV